MVERNEGSPSEKQPETVEEVSERLRGIFKNVQREHPEELYIWQSAFYDIIDQAQMQYNTREFMTRRLEGNDPNVDQRFHEESEFLTIKDKFVIEKMENDARYDRSYEMLSRELIAMQTAFARRGTSNHLGATIRELRRVKRSVEKYE